MVDDWTLKNRAQALAAYHKNKEAINEKRRSQYAKDTDKPLDYWFRHAVARMQERNQADLFRAVVTLERKLARRFRAKVLKILRRRLQAAFSAGRKFSKTARDLLGCEIPHFRAHLESLWKPGMSWENYGFYGWHIDHIKPCAKFDLADPEQQKACFHWTNLQPLWAKENFDKRDS